MNDMAKYEYHCRTVVDNAALSASKLNFDVLVRRDMANKLAYAIADKEITVLRGERTTVYTAELLVMTYDEFYRLVRKVAAKVQMRPDDYLFDLLRDEQI